MKSYHAVMDTSTTFKVSEVKVERVTNLSVRQRTTATETRASICTQLDAYQRHHCSVVLNETPFASSMVRANRNGGFVRTVIECYNGRHNLTIRPDDIWTAIVIQFSFYMNKNVDFHQRLTIDFDGRKEFVIKVDQIDASSMLYDHIFASIKRQIDEHLVDQMLNDWILPKFTTTTTDDTISCGIAFMATTSKYFDFVRRRKAFVSSGIPYIKLDGTIDDWENILHRLDMLETFENRKLKKWSEMLRPILMEFIAAKNNEENVDFWNRIVYHHRQLSSSDLGASHINGWLTAFAVFNEEGDDCVNLETLNFPPTRYDETVWPMVEIDCIPSGIITVEMKIVDANDKEFESLLFAGHIAHEVWDDDFTLQPRIGWAVALKSTAEDVKNLHEIARRNGDFKRDACKCFFQSVEL